MRKSGCLYNLAVMSLGMGLTYLMQRLPKERLKSYLAEVLEEMYKRDWTFK